MRRQTRSPAATLLADCIVATNDNRDRYVARHEAERQAADLIEQLAVANHHIVRIERKNT